MIYNGCMNVVIAGGGTGGHLYPAIAAAEGIREQCPSARVTIICTRKPFDRSALEKREIPFIALPSPQGIFSLRSALLLPIRLSQCVLAALRSYQELRPRAILGAGGYGSLPAIIAARIAGIPYAIMEQNTVPGKANRLIAGGAFAIFSQWEEARRAFPGCDDFFHHTGSPLRKEFAPTEKREARAALGIDPAKFVLTVMGGSQGAESLNTLVMNEVARMKRFSGRLFILHLTGARDEDRVRRHYRTLSIPAMAIGYSDRMNLVYSASDFLVSRAGALAIAEIAAVGVPTLFIPYPHAADRHQSRNAEALARNDAAFMIEESDFRGGEIEKIVAEILDGGRTNDKILTNMRAFARPRAREEIAERFLKRIG
ncbi:MAG: hypothetical protein A2Z34_04795 [Planctomycetes bacterium RBG_16_59_8]|nr:MAG: hypothetical protein A2Z34_04795 [Planctomycetes bacterium RBG_16_59_8]